MKQKIYIMIATVLMAFALTGCQYEDGPLISFESPATRLARTWKIDKVYMAGMLMTADEIAMDEGGTNISNTFSKNGDFSVSLTDSMGVAQTMTGKWELVNNNKQIRIYDIPGVDSETSTIYKLTDTELWYWHMDGKDKMEMHWKTN